jgi:hypothetical protein
VRLRQCMVFLAMLTMVAMLGTFALPVAAQGPSLAVAATRRDATGAPYSIPPETDRQGDPQPPLLLPGEYVVVSGTGLPPSQPVQAALAMQTHTFPLPYQNLNAGAATPNAVPTTDASGAFQDLTFVLPAADEVTDTTGQLVIIVGSARVLAPVAIVTKAATTAGAGDKRAVIFGASFFVLAMALLLLLVRGVPAYPARRVSGPRQVVESEAK